MNYQMKCPDFMQEYCYEHSWNLSTEKIEKVWAALQKRETFASGQIFPYRVEFESKDQFGAFEEGELNIHHGPLLSAHGAIGEISDNYRGLNYFLGSYVLSYRLYRPVQLEFFKHGDGISMKLYFYVNPSFKWLLSMGLKTFWKFFGIGFLF